MGYPQLDFAGEEGKASTSLKGPETLKADLRELANMFDPNSTLKNNDSGGIGADNLKASVNTDIAKGIADAAQAISTANLAETKADAAVATADSAETKADAAVVTANSANTNADAAVVTAGLAETKADTAVVTANSANATANALQTDYNTIKPELEAAVIAVDGKADVAYVDQVAANFVLGAVSDGSITQAKLENSVQSTLNNVAVLDADLTLLEGVVATNTTDIANNTSLLAAIAQDYTKQVPYGGTTTNSGNNYSISSPSITALVAGMAISVKINADSSGASTLNWDTKGAKGIKKANGTDVTNLKNGGIYTMRYDGTNFILQGEGASGNATAADLTLGKTATVDSGEITGTGENAKRVASGQATSSTTGLNFTNDAGSVVAFFYFTVTGLTFTPKRIIMYDSNGLYIHYNDAYYSSVSQILAQGSLFRKSGNAYVNSTSFQLPIANSNKTLNWIAYE